MDHTYLLTPLIGFAVVGLLALLLRWTFGRGRSLVPRTPRKGSPDDYGLLVEVASPADPAHGRRLCRVLSTDGIRSTLVETTDGPRVMVWPPDEEAARLTLARHLD
ncbi:hypothetical protein LO772_12045 [Yinghuangia sp. ASG 101]|uniref:hypothetical protein n=1 Tax=Yinghuangia sp. ASG 101 TaxID=2896848 RepID=UPI001E4D8987|nr:hypothetical protein [Yinghuangia sp. ASG 101]UGQ14252.1 hypothetical protein LO772_12045 [Yinghuangia sp. ASG 101]